METIDTQTWIIIAAVVVLGLVAIGAWLFYQKKQSHRLQEHFGPEYDRTVNELGSRTKGESELKAREKRVERLEGRRAQHADLHEGRRRLGVHDRADRDADESSRRGEAVDALTITA